METVCRRFGEQVVVGIDARDGIVATRGWLESTTATAVDLACTMVGLGASRFIYTDISRDGTLTSPNFEATADLVSRVSVPVIAAGGLSSVEDLTRLAAVGVEGAVVGRAIYTGDVRLPEALQRIPQQPEER
jgi:phosphoribosylformimino-5-aminoimidazole carboxamide ribotide isomerase